MRKFMNMTLYQSAKNLSCKSKGFIPSFIVTSALTFAATSAFAAGNTMNDLFTTVDISGAQNTVYSLFLGLIGIGMLFFGRRILRKTGVSL